MLQRMNSKLGKDDFQEDFLESQSFGLYLGFVFEQFFEKLGWIAFLSKNTHDMFYLRLDLCLNAFKFLVTVFAHFIQDLFIHDIFKLWLQIINVWHEIMEFFRQVFQNGFVVTKLAAIAEIIMDNLLEEWFRFGFQFGLQFL